MVLQFDLLSDILIEEIFQLVNPEELFDLCFLNKCLFKIVRNVIEGNLRYSIYNQEGFKKYQHDYQEKFIKEEGLSMKHVNINGNNIGLLHYCPNVASLNYNHTGNNNNSNKLELRLPKLKKLNINCLKHRDSLNLFIDLLKQVEAIKISGHIIIINTIVEYFNPDKLHSLIIDAGHFLYLDGIDIVKVKFDKLKVLRLESKGFIDNSIPIDSNLNFVPNLRLEIIGDLDYNLDLKCFGDLKQLHSIKILNSNYHYFNNRQHSDLTEIGNDNITALGYFELKYLDNYDFFKLPALKEIHVNDFSIKLLQSISSLSNIQIIHFVNLNFNITQIFDKFGLDNNNFCKGQYSRIKCKFIKQIKIDFYNGSFDNLLDFLSSFTNIEVVSVKILDLISIDVKFNYKFTIPFLLFAPSKYIMNIPFYIDPKKIPMLNWVSL
ncbi:hypothetical protein K502DRAFT_328001 [Neoconidiobolus thromboides FSU 785]|nr:hypothetical protein K502DRAFT_328001 [Neoconidiobolus thromboides FSU 785]